MGVCFLHFYCQRLPKAFSAIAADFMSYYTEGRGTMFWIRKGAPGGQLVCLIFSCFLDRMYVA